MRNLLDWLQGLWWWIWDDREVIIFLTIVNMIVILLSSYLTQLASDSVK